MPFKSDAIPINNPKHDKRVKLTDEDKENIRTEYAAGDTSYSKLAAKYGVSKRTIQFVIKPEKLEKAKEQFKERRKDGRYYDREKHNAGVRKHRQYKKELFDKGLISKEDRK